MMLRQNLLLLLFLLAGSSGFSQIDTRLFQGKLSPALKTVMAASQGTDSIQMVIAVKETGAFLKNNKNFQVVATYAPAGIIIIKIPAKDAGPVLQQAEVQFADAIKAAKEELTTGYLNLTVNKLNLAHTRFPDIDGSGIKASIKEQQFDTFDIDYKNRYLNAGVGAATVTTHASIMATTLAGAGNSSPFAMGAAPGATISSSSFAVLLPDADAVYRQHGISVQNHSYGTVVESYYGAEAMAYDKSVLNNPELVHVFSAGNAGISAANSGTYAGLTGLSTLTGNFKQAKNIITVGAIDSFYRVPVGSSKGPAYDGRVKPQLVAFGEDGSSGAAALTSGAVALVQQAYKNLQNRLPSAALVKAVLLNSADDAGAPHVDYTSGYGSLNGYAAVNTIVEKRHFEDAVASNASKTFVVKVPANAAIVKFTLAWIDEAAPVNTPKALVNDLDMVVKHSATGETWLPWILNTFPHADSLTKEAKRDRDTLNNVEQVTIENAPAGDYIIEVKAGRIITASQPFAIAYQIDTLDSFEWSFPTANDVLIAGKTNVIRWQSNKSGTAVIEYATANNNWQTIGDNVAVIQQYFKWHTPDTLTTAQLRMRFDDKSIITDSFVISKAVNVAVGFNCKDSFLLFWNHLPAPLYQVYQLGSQNLQPVTVTADTFAIFNKAAHPSFYYSVAPLINGKPGFRSFIVNYNGQGADCYFRSFYVQLQQAGKADFAVQLGSLFNVSGLSLQKLQGNAFATVKNINAPGVLSFTVSDSSLTRGLNRYRLQLKLMNGNVVYSNEVSLYHFPDDAVVIYPNPAPQGQPVNIITNLAGRVSIEVIHASGVVVKQMLLKDLVNNIPPLQLSTGLYFIRITTEDGSITTQKLVVY